ncbi:hypothetical protein ACFQU5_10955 [Ureibacillus sp. GCM10028918]
MQQNVVSNDYRILDENSFQVIIGVLIVIFVAFVYVNKLYYPSLPIDGLSAKEAIDSLNASDSKIVQIAEEGNSLLYITRIENKG